MQRPSSIAAPVRVVLDTDPGIDDAMAILYGLLAPEVEVVAIGCVWGNVEVETGTANALRLLEVAGCPEVPVARGAAKPLLGPLPPLATWVHGADGQGSTFLPPPRLEPTGETAAAQLVRLAHEQPGQLTLVPIGPLTNVAIALGMDPGIARLYKEVVLMGGAFLAPGNATRVAEANIRHDPEAAQLVLEAGWPVTLVGLDVTERVRVSQALFEQLRASGTPAGQHLHRITADYLSLYERRVGVRECAIHDALALGIAVDRGLVRRAPRVRVDVERAGTHTRGMTVADLRLGVTVADPWPAGPSAAVVLEVDGQHFVDRWLAVLGQPRA